MSTLPQDFGALTPGITQAEANGVTSTTATQLYTKMTIFDVVAVGGIAQLPSTNSSMTTLTVLNRCGTGVDLLVIPDRGGEIEALGVDVGVTIADGDSLTFTCLDPVTSPGRQWWLSSEGSLSGFVHITGDTMTGPLVNTAHGASAQVLAIAPSGNLSANPSGVTPRTFSARAIFTGSITESPAAAYNRFLADNDIANSNAAQGGGSYLMLFGHTLGTGFKGGRTTVGIDLEYTGTSTNAPANKFYVALGVTAHTSKTDGGSGGTPLGAFFGQNIIIKMDGTATNWYSAVGLEVDMVCGTGASVAYKRGVKVVSWTNDTVRGSVDDFAFGVGMIASSGATAGFHTYYQCGDASGWWAPVDTLFGVASTLIAGGPAVQAAKGIALSTVTFTTSAWESTGATLDPSGNWTVVSVGNGVTSLQIGGAGSWTANGSVATALSSVGPTGAHTAVQEWLTFKNASGITRYIPAF